MSYPCTIYHRPNGRAETIEIWHIDDADAAWFRANNVKLSMEEDGAGGVIAYADVGLRDEDGEPNEAIEISRGRPCEETLAALRGQCEAILKGRA